MNREPKYTIPKMEQEPQKQKSRKPFRIIALLALLALLGLCLYIYTGDFLPATEIYTTPVAIDVS